MRRQKADPYGMTSRKIAARFRNVFRAGTVIAIALSGCGKAEKEFFPTGLGSQWTYRGVNDKSPITTEARVTSSKQEGGRKTVVIQWTQDGQPFQDETYLVS